MTDEKKIYDEVELRKAINILVAPGYPFEVRIIGNGVNWSGYFESAEEVVEAWGYHQFIGCNVYITLQNIDEACASRQNRGVFVKNAKPVTSDSDIEGYRWFFIDVDPKRPAGVSSSECELAYAVEKAKAIKSYLDR